jgi:hypothetical protein
MSCIRQIIGKKDLVSIHRREYILTQEGLR